MTPPLFLVDALPDDDGDFLLDGDEGHHAARVKRLGVGELLLVGDGAGTVARCEVVAVELTGLRLHVRTRHTAPVPAHRLVVVQALPKGERAELAIETMTELGVDEIVPWSAARSVVQWQGLRGEKALGKWRRSCREAAKQSRRPRVPLVAEPASTGVVAERLRSATLALVLHEDADAPWHVPTPPSAGEVVVVVGPEGGITIDELTAFAAVGATAVRLGGTVLRTSTAGPAALAVLSCALGRWA